MRIVSLLPSITEIVSALGKQDQLVGRSHECDFPPEVTSLPACTEPKFDAEGNSYQIDQRVKALLQEGLSIYRVDEEVLADLDPDIILTQDHCEVCAASVDEVKEAVHQRLGEDVRVVSVSPSDLSSVIDAIRAIALAIDAEEAMEELTARMKSRLREIQDKVTDLRRPDLLAVEWLDPLMVAENWVPQLIQLAGGNPVGAESGAHSPDISWGTIKRYDPDILTIMPCGYSIDQTLADMSHLTSREGWQNLRAVKNKQVFILDGHHYFNRPGPRLVESTKILAEILHPSLFREGQEHHPRGWINLAKYQFHQNMRAS